MKQLLSRFYKFLINLWSSVLTFFHRIFHNMGLFFTKVFQRIGKGIVEIFSYAEGILFFVKSITSDRQFLYISCILVGASAGVAVIILKTFARAILQFATSIDGISNIPISFSILPIIGIVLTVFVVRKFLSGNLVKGTTEIMISIAKRAGIIPKKQMYAQIITSSLTVGLGGSLGLESPTAITGAAFGSNYAQNYLLTYKERVLLLASGVAAGIGAMYNAPIGGIFYAVEIILLEVSTASFIPILISSVTGTLVANSIKKESLLLSVKDQLIFTPSDLPYYIALGIVVGLFSVYHARMYRATVGKLNSYVGHPYKKALLGATLLGLMILIFPSLFGEGYDSIRLLIGDNPERILHKTIFERFDTSHWVLIAFVLAAGFVKTIAVGLTLGSGGNGGDFAPALFSGSYIGFAFGKILTLIGFTHAPVHNLAVVGMAGLICGLFHSPLTAIFLIVEVTNGYALLPPLLIVVALCYAISKKLEKYSMDVKELIPTGQVFTSDQDSNILATIDVEDYIKNDAKVLKNDASSQEILDALSSTIHPFIPVVDQDQKLTGVVFLNKARPILFSNNLDKDILLSEIVSPAIYLQDTDSAKTFMECFDKEKVPFILVEKQGLYDGYVSKSDLMDAYRLNLKTMLVS